MGWRPTQDREGPSQLKQRHSGAPAEPRGGEETQLFFTGEGGVGAACGRSKGRLGEWGSLGRKSLVRKHL